MVKWIGGGFFFQNNSGFSYHFSLTPSSKQYMLRSELDIAPQCMFAIIIHSGAMYMTLNTQGGLVNPGLP